VIRRTKDDEAECKATFRAGCEIAGNEREASIARRAGCDPEILKRTALQDLFHQTSLDSGGRRRLSMHASTKFKASRPSLESISITSPAAVLKVIPGSLNRSANFLTNGRNPTPERFPPEQCGAAYCLPCLPLYK
jgi:hypothetical protein